MKSMAAILALAALAVAGCASAPAPAGGGAQLAAPNIDVTPGPGISGTLTGPVAVVSTDASATDTGVICKKADPKTGSRLGARDVCMTKAQWDEVEAAAKGFAKDTQDSGKWNFQSGN